MTEKPLNDKTASVILCEHLMSMSDILTDMFMRFGERVVPLSLEFCNGTSSTQFVVDTKSHFLSALYKEYLQRLRHRS